MKHQLIVFTACALLVACSNNKAAPETTIAQTKQQPETASSTGTNQPSGDGIVGVWKLTLECYDDNGNKTPDEAERKKVSKTITLFALIPMEVARSSKCTKAAMK
jgi:hypothetical protein